MSWGCHPDTITMAIATGKANKSPYKKHSLEWLKIYREAYEIATDGEWPESLKEYLSNLDKHINEKQNAHKTNQNT